MYDVQLLQEISDQIKTVSAQVDQLRVTNESVGQVLVFLVNLVFGMLLGVCSALGVTRAWKS